MSGARADRRSSRTSCARSATSSTATSCRTSPATSTPTSSPTPLVETMRELGLFGTTIPEEYGGLGLDLTTYALIVEGALARLDLAVRRHQHALHRLVHDQDVRDPGAEGRAAAADGARRLRSAFSMTEPHAGSRRAGDPHAGGARRRRVRDQRAEDVGHERPAGRLVMLLAVTDPTAVPAPRRDDGVHRREGAGRRELPGLTIPPPLEEARLQGRRVHRARVRRLPHPRREHARRRGGLDRASSSSWAASSSGRVNVAARGLGHRRRPPSRTRSATPRSARRSASRSPSTS